MVLNARKRVNYILNYATHAADLTQKKVKIVLNLFIFSVLTFLRIQVLFLINFRHMKYHLEPRTHSDKSLIELRDRVKL